MDKALRKWRYLFYSSVIFFFDFSSKYLTKNFLPSIYESTPTYPYGGIGVFKNFLGIEFSLNHAINKGAAWGMFSNYPFLLILVRVVLVLGLIFYFFKFSQQKSRFPLMLVITGAFCNILDFFLYGHVIDMFHIILWGYDYPIFNVADISITVGIVILFIQGLRNEN